MIDVFRFYDSKIDRLSRQWCSCDAGRMDLHARIGKIATGISVSDAIEAYVNDLAQDGEIADPKQAARDELLAIVEVMFLMAAVDGEVAEEEVGQLQASLEALSDMRAVDRPELAEILGEYASKLAGDGWTARLKDASSRIRTGEAKAFAFRLAAGVAFVDDFVAHAEAAAIDTLAKSLGLSDRESQSLLREVHETLFGGP